MSEYDCLIGVFFFLNKQLCFKYLPYTFFFPKTCMLLTFGFNLFLVVGLRYYCFVRTFFNFDFESLSPICLTQIVAEKMAEKNRKPCLVYFLFCLVQLLFS